MPSLGHAAVSPKDPVVVGSMASWTITITVGDHGFDRMSEIAVVRSSTCDMEVSQFADPHASGYTTAQTHGQAELALRFDTRLYRAPWRAGIAVRLARGMLKPGDQIMLRLGDRRSGSPGLRAQTFPQSRHTFRVLADYFGTGDFRDIEQDTQVAIVAGKAERAELVVPSRVNVGEPFDVCGRTLDHWGNPSPSFAGTLSLLPAPGLRVDPAAPQPRDWHTGTAVIGSAAIEKPGVFRLRASGDFDAESNPIVAAPAGEDTLPIFWSDMHWQTDSTVGIGSVEECLSYARDAALLHVAGWQGNDFQIRPEGWDEMQREVARFNAPGRFVVFPGYEHSALRPTGGDHNVYFLTDRAEFFPSSRWQNEDVTDAASVRESTRRLVGQFRGRRDVMIVPHVGGRASNLDYFDPELMPVIEIFSHHGSFEWLARDALARGLVVGFVATSDDHTGRPGLTSPTELFAAWNQSLDLTGGTTGIYAPALTREEIWRAIKARHCFATTGARMILEVRMGDKMMGDIVEGPPDPLRVSIIGTAPLLEAEVLRGPDVVHRHVPAPPGQSARTALVVCWRGPTAGPVAGKVFWRGRLSFSPSRIRRFEEMGFRKLGDGVRSLSESELEITSTTSGNLNGVRVELGRAQGSQLTFTTEALSFVVPLSQIGERGKSYVNSQKDCEVIVRQVASAAAPREVSFSYSDERPAPGMNPYWIRAVQTDGNEAWSSPIYVRR